MNRPNVTRVPIAERHTALLQAFANPYAALTAEQTIYQFLTELCDQYHGGYWEMYRVNNGAFFMVPELKGPLTLTAPNGATKTISCKAAGITACLYAYSHLSFSIAEPFSDLYHALREYMLDQEEAPQILALID